MRWCPSTSGKLCAVFPSETFSIGMDVRLQGGRRLPRWVARPFQPWESWLSSASSPTHTKGMWSHAILSLAPFNGEPEAQRGEPACPKSHSQNGVRDIRVQASLTETLAFTFFLSFLCKWQLERLRVYVLKTASFSLNPFYFCLDSRWFRVQRTQFHGFLPMWPWLTNATCWVSVSSSVEWRPCRASLISLWEFPKIKDA